MYGPNSSPAAPISPHVSSTSSSRRSASASTASPDRGTCPASQVRASGRESTPRVRRRRRSAWGRRRQTAVAPERHVRAGGADASEDAGRRSPQRLRAASEPRHQQHAREERDRRNRPVMKSPPIDTMYPRYRRCRASSAARARALQRPRPPTRTRSSSA